MDCHPYSQTWLQISAALKEHGERLQFMYFDTERNKLIVCAVKEIPCAYSVDDSEKGRLLLSKEL